MFWAVLRSYWPLCWNRVSSWLVTAQLWLNLTQCHSLAFICFFTDSWKLHRQGSPPQHVAGCQNLFGEWLPVKVYIPKRESSRHLSCSFRLTMNLSQLANTWRDMPGRRGRIKRRAENNLEQLTQPFLAWLAWSFDQHQYTSVYALEHKTFALAINSGYSSTVFTSDHPCTI